MATSIAVPVAGQGVVYSCAHGRTVDWAEVHIRKTFNVTGGSVFCDGVGADEADVIEGSKVYSFVGGFIHGKIHGFHPV